MIDRKKVDAALTQLPLYVCEYIDPKDIVFSEKVRWICEKECPMYAKTWACPPAVGTVEECKEKCLSYNRCLLIGSVQEIEQSYSMEKALSTRPAHEELTRQTAKAFTDQGVSPYILSTEACAECESCTFPEGKPCRHPDRMHPCVESHGINLIPTLESLGLDFRYGNHVITWYSLLFFNE